jgi:CheY-like chemotaxis protein
MLDSMKPRLTILIADDNRDWTDTLAAILREEGHVVHTAYDGREAVEAATKVSPNVVLLDISMPRLTGYEVARVFRGQSEKTRPVIIAVTGRGRESDQLRGQVAGFDYHLLKPVDPAAILALLASVQRDAAAPRRILVVDDDRDWTDALAELLRIDGHTVRTAYDGREALAEAASFTPEVVLLDLRMPLLAGEEVARTFRRQPPATRPLLIAVTGMDAEANRKAALQAGFDHFVSKPVDLPALNRLLAMR